MENENLEYKIDGKKNSLVRIIVMLVLTVIMTVLAVDQFKPAENKSVMLGFVFIVMAVIPAGLLVYSLNRRFFFKINIGTDGFYVQTNPINGKHYSYAEIDNGFIKTETPTKANQGADVRYYFVFTTKNRETRKILFEPAVHEREIEILKERINTK